MRHFSMVVVVGMGTDKHCAASRKTIEIESAASEMQCVKNTCAENFAITNKRDELSTKASVHEQIFIGDKYRSESS